jgi:hypothetical protein
LDNRLVLICCRKFHKFTGYRITALLPHYSSIQTKFALKKGG